MITPEAGKTYGDDEGRRLSVTNVAIDPRGRDVQGELIQADDSGPTSYTTSLVIFGKIWTKEVSG